jgi:hypothetical protein
VLDAQPRLARRQLQLGIGKGPLELQLRQVAAQRTRRRAAVASWLDIGRSLARP